jgi:hypothetical protein
VLRVGEFQCWNGSWKFFGQLICCCQNLILIDFRSCLVNQARVLNYIVLSADSISSNICLSPVLSLGRS